MLMPLKENKVSRLKPFWHRWRKSPSFRTSTFFNTSAVGRSGGVERNPTGLIIDRSG
jgi:hypothetical protein